MKVSHYPSMSHIVNEYRKIGGNQTGIIPGNFISVTEFPGEPYMRTMTAMMPAYHRLMLDDPTMEMQYHLSGYGMYHEEALIKLMGESVERYGAMVAMETLGDQIHYDTYRNLSSTDKVMPLKYLGLFDAEQQQQVHAMMPKYADTKPTDDDVIGWIKCPSLVEPGLDVWVPAQLFFLGFRTTATRADRMFSPSFSTGTAAHVSTTKALKNALIESIQIDAFILNWYTSQASAAEIVIDDDNVLRMLHEMGLGPDSCYDMKVAMLTRPELPLPNFGIYMIRKDEKIPFLSFGVQADPDPQYAVLRGSQECAAILGMGMYGAVFDTEQFHFASTESAYTDLDTNVQMYANPEHAQAKLDVINSRFSGEKLELSSIPPLATSDEEAVSKMIGMLAEFSEWAVYLDITPAELHDSDWRVMRTLIPELCSMCLPGLPPHDHPRFAEYGGVTNVRPHPLP